MELVYVTVIGAGIGLLMRYVLPRRASYGIILLPAIGAAVTAAVWVGLVWIGVTFDNPWIWVASLGAAGVVSILVAVLLPLARRSSDARYIDSARGARA